MKARLLLGVGLLCACATKPAVERVQPNPPAGSETIRLRHADAHDIAQVLNDREEARFWKSLPPGCALPAPRVDFPVPDIAKLAFEDQHRWKEVRDPDELVRLTADITAEALRGHLQQPPERIAGPHIRPPPETFLPWDSRTLVVLEAHRDADYFEQVRALVRRLDEDRVD